MGLRIANNISAMNTHRWLGVADTGLNKSLERLSSGYRINRAADDAAGLAISQGFRANIASFKVASRNTSEASALLQVAEGGMDQIGNMLTRLKELATQAASANSGSSEKAKIDAEADQLITEIDRIANSTKYGSTELLNGNFGLSQTATLAAGSQGDGMIGSTNVVYDFTVIEAGTVVDTLGDSVAEGTKFYMTFSSAGTGGTVYLANSAGTTMEKFAFTDDTQTVATFTNLGIQMTFSGAISDATISAAAAYCTQGATYVEFTRTGLTSLTANNAATGTYTISDAGTGTIKLVGPTMDESESFAAYGSTITFDQQNITFNLSSDWARTGGELNGMQFTVAANTAAIGSTFQIGSENDSNNRISISIDGVETTTLGISTIDLSTASGAQAALSSINDAISTLAGSRGDIGAYMNRLAYASANLATTIENTQAAESVIRDVDMASEMTEFTKNQILLQAGTAMLAQANMAPQQILALFG